MSAAAGPDHVEMLRIRAFARREDCDEALVRRAIRIGRLPDLSSKLLPASLVGTGWRLSNRRRIDAAEPSADTAADIPHEVRILAAPEAEVAAIAEAMVNEAAPYSLAEAERRKENALAGLRQLELDQKSGLVVVAADVAQKVGAAFARVRARLLAVPAEQAPQLHRCKTTAELQGRLTDVFHDLLRELSA